MERIKVWIESHPYLSGALVLGIVLLWLVRRRASSSQAAPAGVVYGGDPNAAAELQAAYGLSAAQIQAQAQNQQLQSATTIQALNDAAQVQLGQFQRDVQLQGILSGADVTNNQTAASLALGLANIGQPYSFSGSIGGLNFSGGAAVAPTTVVNTTTQTQQQQTQAQAQQQVLSTVNPTAVTNPVPASGMAVVSSNGQMTPVTSAPPIYGELGLGPQGQESFVLPQVAQGAPVAPGGNYLSTYGAIPGGVQNPFNQFGVAQQTANVNAAETAYVTDPNSCHNSISPNCVPLGGY